MKKPVTNSSHCNHRRESISIIKTIYLSRLSKNGPFHSINELFKCRELNQCSAYHPETNGQMEIVNGCLEDLSCFIANNPKLSSGYIGLNINTTFHDSTGHEKWYCTIRLEHLDEVADKLQFPTTSKIHLVFHMSFLNKATWDGISLSHGELLYVNTSCCLSF
ncbi:hypothetical protein CR513_63052, partial [Mucuna pruriens]